MEEKINTEEFQKIISDLLEGYEKLENKGDLDEYLQAKLKDYGVAKDDEAKDIVGTFKKTLNGIADKFKNLLSFKKKGKSTQQWLKQDLDKSMKDLEEEDKSIIMESIDKALKSTKDEHKKVIEKVKKLKVKN